MSGSNEMMHQLVGLLTDFEIIDLSHTLEEYIPTVPTHTRFAHNLVQSYVFGDMACHYQLVMSEHTGTHIDAPLHFIPEGKAHYGMDQVPLEKLVGRALSIDCSDLAPRSTVTLERLQQWEKEHEKFQQGDILLVSYGWFRRWKKAPDHHEFVKDWPGIGKEAAEYIVQKGIKMVGCDALSVDAYGCEGRPAHYELLGNEVLIMENLNNLDLLPPVSYFIALPLKIKGGSGSPIRPIAFIPKTR